MITDPLLKQKLDLFGEEYGLAYEYQRLAVSRRMRGQDQNIGAYLIFIGERETCFFNGFEQDGKRIEGFSEIVGKYFEKFPAKICSATFSELNAYLEQRKRAGLESVSMDLNQLLQGNQDVDRQNIELQIESSIASIENTEVRRLFNRLLEAKQELEARVEKEKTLYESILDWARNKPLFVGLSLAFLIIAALAGFITNVKTIFSVFLGG